MADKLTQNNSKRQKQVKKPTDFKNRGDSASKLMLMQIENELNRSHFNVNDVDDKIAKYSEHIVLITEQIYAGKIQMFSAQRLAHTLGISREYLYELAAADYPNSKLLKKALQGWKLAVSDNLICGGLEKKYSEGLSKHWVNFFDASAFEHEKAIAMLKQLESNTQPIQVILNKPSVTGKHKSECGDTEPDGGF